MSSSKSKAVVKGRSNNGGGFNDVEYELDELHREYRQMESNRKGYTEDSQNTINMQRQQIGKLKKDNQRLKEDLALETRQAKHANNNTASATIAQLQEQAEVYKRKIRAERQRIADLDEQIGNMQEDILQQRKNMGGYNAGRENAEAVQKEIRRLENRLDKALVKHNEAVAYNNKLRDDIDNLRKEREVFDGISAGLEAELHEKKKIMADIIRRANEAYEARDAAQAEMLKLKAEADREQALFVQRWEELDAMIEEDRKMREYQSSGDRSGAGGAGGADGDSRALVSADGAEQDDGAEEEDPALTEEMALEKRKEILLQSIRQHQTAIDMANKKVHNYGDSFAKIQNATNINDIDQLVTTFLEAENHNFELFNHVNKLSAQIEELEETIAGLEKQIAEYEESESSASGGAPKSGAGKKKGSSDNQRKRILHDLETQVSETEERAKQYEKRHTDALETVNALKSGIERIFHAIGCADEMPSANAGAADAEEADDRVKSPAAVAAADMLGSAGVTESNMMTYLGIIEQRTNELLDQYQEQLLQLNPASSAANKAADDGDEDDDADKKPKVVLPEANYDDDEEDDDEDAQPISIEEMNRFAASSLQQHQAASEEAPQEQAQQGDDEVQDEVQDEQAE